MTTSLVVGIPSVQHQVKKIETSDTYSDFHPIYNSLAGPKKSVTLSDDQVDGVSRISYGLGSTSQECNFLAIARADILQACGVKRVLLRASSYSAFLPQEISGLTLWLDSTRRVTHTAGAVSQWDDVSGNSVSFTQGTGANQPTRTADDIEGNTSISFDGTNDSLSSSTTLASIISESEFTAFFVYKASVLDSTARTIFTAEIGASEYITLYVETDNKIYLINRDSGGIDYTAGITYDTNVNIIKCRHSGGNIYISVNGGAESSGVSGDTTSLAGTITLGRRSAGTYASGKLLEVIFYNRDIGTTESTKINTYLVDKWKTVEVYSDSAFDAATLYGTRENDYIADFTLSSANSYYWVDLDSDESAKRYFSKISCGEWWDPGTEPNFNISRTQPKKQSFRTDSGALDVARPDETVYSIDLAWEGVTDNIVKEWWNLIAKNAAAKRGVWLYSRTRHEVLDNKQLLYCDLLNPASRPISTISDYNRISATFEEMIG